MDTIGDAPFVVGEWTVEPELNRLVRGEEIIKLDTRHLKVLALLASRPGQLVTQAEIEAAVWADVVVTPNSVYQSVAHLRKAFGDESRPRRYIETIARKGYRLVAEVRPVAREVAAPEVAPVAAATSEPKPAVQPIAPRPVPMRWGAMVAAVIVAVVPSGWMILANTNGAKQEQATDPSVPVASAAPSEQQQSFDGWQPLDTVLGPGVSPESPTRRSYLLYEMANDAINNGYPDEAIRYVNEALELQKRFGLQNDPAIARRLVTLATSQYWNSDYAAAERSVRTALEIFQSISELHPETIDALRVLGDVLTESEQPEQAEECLLRALEMSRTLFGEEGLQTYQTKASLALLRYAQGRMEEAEKLTREVIEAHPKRSANVFVAAPYRQLLIRVLLAQREYVGARDEAQALLHSLAGQLRADHPYVAAATEVLGLSLIGLGEYSLAEGKLRHAIQLWNTDKRWGWRAAGSASALGEALLAQGRVREAEKYLTYASRGLEGLPQGRLENELLDMHRQRLAQLRAAMAEASDAQMAVLTQ